MDTLTLRRTLILLLVVIATIFAFFALRTQSVEPKTGRIEFVSTTPNWIDDPNRCTEMNDDERAQQELALKVLQTFPHISTMNIAAIKHFGHDRYRHAGKDVVRLCPPIAPYAAISQLALAQGVFSGPYLHEDGLRLARALGPRDPKIAEAVARTGFHTHTITTESTFKEDIRSLARVTLAEFGPAAEQWSAQAYQSINADDALGTSAAQVAVATGHPQALDRVATLLEAILRDHPKDPIPLRTRDRFYELAYAVARAGYNGRAFANPILRMANRKVESWAPPFGIVSLPPWPLCRVLELIGGPDADKARTGDVCHSKMQ